MAFYRQNTHAHRTHPGRHRPADIAVAQNADGLAGNFDDIERLPATRLLVAIHAAEILGKVQDRGQRKFAQRLAEDAASVSQRHGALHQGGKEHAIQARRARVHPAHLGTHGEDVAQQIAGGRPAEDDRGVGGQRARTPPPNCPPRCWFRAAVGPGACEIGVGQIRRQYQDCLNVHQEKATTCSTSHWKCFASWRTPPSRRPAPWGWATPTPADQAAVESMRRCLDTLAIDGTIVIGEGERDEAPMLYIGEKRGARNGGHDDGGHRGRSAGGHESVRHRRRGRHHRAGGIGARRPAARAGLLHGKDRGRAGGQGRGGPGCAGEAESQGHRAAPAARRGRPGGGGARPAAPRRTDRRYSRGRRAHPPDLRWRPRRRASPPRWPEPACMP